MYYIIIRQERSQPLRWIVRRRKSTEETDLKMAFRKQWDNVDRKEVGECIFINYSSSRHLLRRNACCCRRKKSSSPTKKFQSFTLFLELPPRSYSRWSKYYSNDLRKKTKEVRRRSEAGTCGHLQFFCGVTNSEHGRPSRYRSNI